MAIIILLVFLCIIGIIAYVLYLDVDSVVVDKNTGIEYVLINKAQAYNNGKIYIICKQYGSTEIVSIPENLFNRQMVPYKEWIKNN